MQYKLRRCTSSGWIQNGHGGLITWRVFIPSVSLSTRSLFQFNSFRDPPTSSVTPSEEYERSILHLSRVKTEVTTFLAAAREKSCKVGRTRRPFTPTYTQEPRLPPSLRFCDFIFESGELCPNHVRQVNPEHTSFFCRHHWAQFRDLLKQLSALRKLTMTLDNKVLKRKEHLDVFHDPAHLNDVMRTTKKYVHWLARQQDLRVQQADRFVLRGTAAVALTFVGIWISFVRLKRIVC